MLKGITTRSPGSMRLTAIWNLVVPHVPFAVGR